MRRYPTLWPQTIWKLAPSVASWRMIVFLYWWSVNTLSICWWSCQVYGNEPKTKLRNDSLCHHTKWVVPPLSQIDCFCPFYLSLVPYYATKSICDFTLKNSKGSRESVFLALDKPCLRPLPKDPFESFITKMITSIDYDPVRKIKKMDIARLSGCDWIQSGSNLIITGATGVGKHYNALSSGNLALSTSSKRAENSTFCTKNLCTLFMRGYFSY